MIHNNKYFIDFMERFDFPAEAKECFDLLTKKLDAETSLGEKYDSILNEYMFPVANEEIRPSLNELTKLAEENGIDLGMQRPRGGRNMRGENPNAGAPRRRQTVNIGRLRRAYPAEMEKLDELRKTDPAAYRAGIRKLSEQMEKGAQAPQK